MSAQQPRDRALERLLERATAPGPASADCLDPETLAAWADGGLDQKALARAEDHMASCARCQTMMAAVVTSGSDPARAALEDRAWWRVNLRWLFPLAGAATALLLWTVVPDTSRNQAARVDDRASSELADAEVPAPPANAPAAAAPVPDTSTPQKSTEQMVARAEPPGRSPARQQQAGTREATDRLRKSKEADQQTSDVMAKAENRSTPIAGAAPAAPPVLEERAAQEADRRAAAPTAPAPAPSTQAFRVPAEATADSGVAATTELSSRDSAVRWRIAGPGTVERSLDQGSTWERLDTGTQTALAAGSCPSASVCWVVGGSGAVLLTTDARAWRRTSPPSAENLIAVEASDATTAVVRSAQGQAYRTTDGGVSWTRVP